jgi:predicted nucleotidyltransferase
MSISNEHNAEITRVLHALEATHEFHVLFAVEAGSRCWGWATQNSDYDVRFIYAHPLDYYVSLEEGRRDFLEHKERGIVEADFQGWDIKKTLKMLREGNPALSEWLRSPIRYREETEFVQAMATLSHKHSAAKTSCSSWLSVARKHDRLYIEGKQTVALKKYFYILRPLLSILWFQQRDASTLLAPLQLGELLASVEMPDAVKREAGALLERKFAGTLGQGERIAAMDEWMHAHFDALENYNRSLPYAALPDLIEFNQLLRETLYKRR